MCMYMCVCVLNAGHGTGRDHADMTSRDQYSRMRRTHTVCVVPVSSLSATERR